MGDESPIEEQAQESQPRFLPLGWDDKSLTVVFFISLERPLAVPEGLTLTAFRSGERVGWVHWTGGANFVSMRVHRPPVVDVYRHDAATTAWDVAGKLLGHEDTPAPEGITFGRVPLPQAEMLATVIEVATPFLPTDDGDHMHAVSDAFDRCLQEIRKVMRSYFSVTQDVRFRPISRQTTAPVVPMAYRTEEGQWSHMAMFMVHLGEGTLPTAPDELTDEQLRQLMITVDRYERGDPLLPFVERARAAFRSYRIDGDYPTVVIAAYTACEVLLSTTLLLMAWEEGRARPETRQWFDGQGGFVTRIMTQIVPRLGGNWGTQKHDSPMGQLRRLADVRHSVIHYGLLPEESSAKDALLALNTLESFVKTRVAEKRKTYPRTALLVMGMPGLQRVGKWDQWMDQFMDTVADLEDDWISGFTKWRDAT